MSQSTSAMSSAMTSLTARKLEAIAAVFARDEDGAPGRRQLQEHALACGVDELYERYVRGTEFDLRRQGSEGRARKRRRSFYVV